MGAADDVGGTALGVKSAVSALRLARLNKGEKLVRQALREADEAGDLHSALRLATPYRARRLAREALEGVMDGAWALLGDLGGFARTSEVAQE